MKKYINALSLVATTLLFGCSTVTNYEQEINSFIANQDLAPMESIDTNGAVFFRALNDNHVALTVQSSKYYLLSVPENCQSIINANKIVIATSVEGVVQANNIDKIFRIGDKYTGCSITGIYQLQSEQLEQLVSWSYRRHPSWNNNLISPSFNDAKRMGI